METVVSCTRHKKDATVALDSFKRSSENEKTTSTSRNETQRIPLTTKKLEKNERNDNNENDDHVSRVLRAVRPQDEEEGCYYYGTASPCGVSSDPVNAASGTNTGVTKGITTSTESGTAATNNGNPVVKSRRWSKKRSIAVLILLTLILMIILAVFLATRNTTTSGNDKEGAIHHMLDVTASSASTRSTSPGGDFVVCPAISLTFPFNKTLQHNSNNVTYQPGNLIESLEYPGLMLSKGLSCRIIANSNKPVQYCQQQQQQQLQQRSSTSETNNSSSNSSSGVSQEAQESQTNKFQSFEPFHTNPDAAGTFVDPRPWNVGGWIYVSNSEDDNEQLGLGGVGALTFDKFGSIIDYQRLIPPNTTKQNCGGGKTPWDTWISCEEHDEFSNNNQRKGQCWQVDPTGERPAQQTKLGGSEGGKFESAAVDNRLPTRPIFFVTEDAQQGALRRYTASPLFQNGINAATSNDTLNKDVMWHVLHMEGGEIKFLIFDPDQHRELANDVEEGVFDWTHNKTLGQLSAEEYYPNTEGIDFIIDQQTGEGILYFVSKELKRLFRLNLDTLQYVSYSTKKGTFDGEPDQIKSIVGDNGILYTYYTEEGGKANGIHGRDKYFRSFTVLEGDDENFKSETTGLAFSPNSFHMYMAFQKDGVLLDCTRQDGFSFKGQTIDMRYHK